MSRLLRWRLWATAAFLLPLVVTPSIWGAATTPAAARSVDPRTVFHLLLADHVHLTASSTGSVIAGRAGELAAAVRALDTNGRELAQALGAVYGPETEQRFLAGWRRHVEFFLWYAKGVMTNDRAMQKKAAEGLERYAGDVGTFMSGANPHLSKDAVADLIRSHTRAVLLVIDAQGAANHAKAYTALRAAVLQSATIGDPLGSAIIQQFPDRFGR
jgi:hypothetical protein